MITSHRKEKSKVRKKGIGGSKDCLERVAVRESGVSVTVSGCDIGRERDAVV